MPDLIPSPLLGRTLQECGEQIRKAWTVEGEPRSGLMRFFENHTAFSHHVVYSLLTHNVPATPIVHVELTFIDDKCTEEYVLILEGVEV